MIFWLFLLLAAVLGASIGSFLTLVTYRLPRDEPIGMTRSRCPACQATLGLADLFPVLSWAVSRGKCRHCKTKVSARYPLTELACALGTVLLAARYGLTLEALALMGLWWSVVAIFVTDLEFTIILDEVQIACAGFAVLYGYATQASESDMITAAITGAAMGLTLKYGFIYLRNKDGLGLGDVKFLAVVGLWLGHAVAFVPFLFFSGILGIVSGILWRVAGLGERFPFGPALGAALLLCVVWPEGAQQFWQLYGILR